MTDFWGSMLGENYNPLGRFFERIAGLRPAAEGAAIMPLPEDIKKKLGKVEVPLGPIDIGMEDGKLTGGHVHLGGDMTLGRQADGWDLNNGKSGIRFNAKTGRFEYYNRGLTVGYGGPDNWQATYKGPFEASAGPGTFEVDKDGFKAGYSQKKGPYVQYNKEFRF